MATRALINIEGITFASIYKHWDGHPDATKPWLDKFNRDFTLLRGVDPEYKFAQLLRNSVVAASTFMLDPSPDTGWGVVPYMREVMQEYVYTLHADGSVTFVTVRP